jgi:hypothetical protein
MLAERSTIRLGGPSIALSGDASGDYPRLLVVTEGLVEAFHLSEPDRPGLGGSWRADGVQGALAFGGELLFWGAPGIWVAADGPPAHRNARFTCCDLEEVRGAAVVRDRLFVLQAGELRVYDSRLCELARFDACGAEQIVAAGRYVVLRYCDGLRVFDGLRGSPENSVVTPLRGATHLEAPPLAFGCDAVYARGRVGTLLLQIMPGGELDRIAEYDTGAWFEGIARVGRTLAFPSPDRRAVVLVEAVKSRKSE